MRFVYFVLISCVYLLNTNKEKMRTFVLVFKSGRRDKFFANNKSDLKTMCNWELVKEVIEIK